ncbi:MAG: hypothetical protein KA777_01320 [Rhodoferax sp.]|nr:hypothetical protein [Rhodoferax sp.]
MPYHQAFDRLGNPVARRVRFPFLRRIADSTDADGVFIIVGCITMMAVLGMWISGWPL